jgi:hypothetical protein
MWEGKATFDLQGEWGIWKKSEREGDPVKRGLPVQVLDADMGCRARLLTTGAKWGP